MGLWFCTQRAAMRRRRRGGGAGEPGALQWIGEDINGLQVDLRRWLQEHKEQERRARELTRHFDEQGIDLERAEKHAKRSRKKREIVIRHMLSRRIHSSACASTYPR